MHDHDDHDHSDLSFEGFTVEEIKKNFKSLGQELDMGGTALDEVIEEVQVETSEPEPYFRGYIPTIKDYLERAQTREECEEIIDYCLKQGEISNEEADRFRYRLEKGGPRAFGSRKPGYYDTKL